MSVRPSRPAISLPGLDWRLAVSFSRVRAFKPCLSTWNLLLGFPENNPWGRVSYWIGTRDQHESGTYSLEHFQARHGNAL